MCGVIFSSDKRREQNVEQKTTLCLFFECQILRFNSKELLITRIISSCIKKGENCELTCLFFPFESLQKSSSPPAQLYLAHWSRFSGHYQGNKLYTLSSIGALNWFCPTNVLSLPCKNLPDKGRQKTNRLEFLKGRSCPAWSFGDGIVVAFFLPNIISSKVKVCRSQTGRVNAS